MTSKREPWHWHKSVVPVRSPPDSGHGSSVHVQVVERVQTTVDACDGDSPLHVVQVKRHDEIVGDRLARPDRPERISCQLGHRLLLAQYG